MKLNKKSTKDNPNFAKVQDQVTLRENAPGDNSGDIKQPKKRKGKNPLAKAAGVK